MVLEKYYNHINTDDLATRHKAHPNWEEKNHIYCSTGSLGMGILVAVGRAIAKPSRKIYVMISDGECGRRLCLGSFKIHSREKYKKY